MPPTRRQFLKSTATLTASAVLSRRVSFAAPPRTPAFTQFNYADIQLLDGPMLTQFQHNHSLFLSLNEDSLLKPFRQLTGQPAPGEDMGGWYSPSPLFDPPKNMTGYIPGHSFGQYLSGLSRAYAITRNAATKAKVDSLVAGLAPTLKPEFYKGYCLPCYTFEKTLGGLIDAHQFAQSPHALAALNAATDAVSPWLPDHALTRPEMEARPHPNPAFTWDEPYTLPENLYIAWQRGAGDRYHALAQRFLQDKAYFQPLADGQNALVHQHAYSHVNALNSAMQAYLTDGSEMHLRAAKNGFQFVLDQSYATGGWGPNEGFTRPGTEELADSLTRTHNSFETPCGAYGHFKIARSLLHVTGDPHYGDSMETILYNTILGARPIRPDGVSFYYADYNDDAAKSDYEQKWPCCSGTFPQLTADYGISTYLRAPNGIAVNLYSPSRLSWRQGGAAITLTQQTSYPANGDIALHLKLDRPERFQLSLRIPAWAGASTRVLINGKPFGTPPQPGAWLLLDRTWTSGDRVELTLDMPLRLVPLDATHPDTVALATGPVVLFALLPSAEPFTRKSLLAATRRSSTSPDWLVATSSAPAVLRPLHPHRHRAIPSLSLGRVTPRCGRHPVTSTTCYHQTKGKRKTMAKTYHDADADLTLIQAKKVAIIGYGSQGHAHALNLKDSGVRGPRRPSRGLALRQPSARSSRVSRSASVAEATKWADVIMNLTPDQTASKVYHADIEPNLTPGKTLMFAHGFNIRFRTITAARRR